ncbi:EH DOMAIN-CONTAINING PROTEIN 2 [Salix purpurea]|uniref:EH DOMAIN-CONTAINING PROTEIN 2 n=1 Tax=Salix purpurea TaxID=77065 RepID=A0A9Q1ALF3_SALPP|nr:EH DOMAIN-CONTAINING PROTEIN 2 [Salix purpurea]
MAMWEFFTERRCFWGELEEEETEEEEENQGQAGRSTANGEETGKNFRGRVDGRIVLVRVRFQAGAIPMENINVYKHLLRCNYPAAHIGPEPTTDRFVVGMLGSDERNIPGNIVAAQAGFARAALIQTFIISHLKKEMPSLMGKAKTQQRIINNLEDARDQALCFVGLPGTRCWENISSFGYRCCLWQKTCPHILGGIKDKADIRGANPMGIPSRERSYVGRPSYDESIVFENRFWGHGSRIFKIT